MTTEASTAVAPRQLSESAVQRILRFTRTERAVHWVQAITFLLLLGSGFALALPAVESVLGHRDILREIHLSTAFFFFFGPAIIALAGDRRSVGQDVRAVDTWNADDLKFLAPAIVGEGFGTEAPQGRFNGGQKLNAIFVAASTLGFTMTGLIMWQNRRFSSDLVSSANNIHTVLAYLALVAFLGHLYLATIHPKTRHAFRAITQGWVNRDWALHHHPKWVRQLAPPMPTPAYDGLRTTLQIFLGAASCAFAVRVYFFWLGANVTDKVTGALYSVTAWPGAASIVPQTGVKLTDWIGLTYMLVCIVAWLAVDQTRRLSRPEPTAP